MKTKRKAKASRRHDTETALERAVVLVGGPTRFSRTIGARTPQVVTNWLRRNFLVPPEFCVAIERATQGRVTRHQLRPDLSKIFSRSDSARAG